VSVKTKEKDAADDIEKWTTPEPGGPQDWVWVERNGMRVCPAKGNWSDLVLPPGSSSADGR